MRFWKRLNSDGGTRTVESYSHDLVVAGATEIKEKEYNAFIKSLPAPEPRRNIIAEMAADIAELEVRISSLEGVTAR